MENHDSKCTGPCSKLKSKVLALEYELVLLKEKVHKLEQQSSNKFILENIPITFEDSSRD